MEQHLSQPDLNWLHQNLPLFVVGKATVAKAEKAGYKTILGKDSGDAVRLAPIILEYYKDKLSSTNLLFPGAKTKIGGLAQKIAPLTVVDVPVYETRSVDPLKIRVELSKIPVLDLGLFFFRYLAFLG